MGAGLQDSAALWEIKALEHVTIQKQNVER